MFATLICVYFEVDIKSFVLAIDFVHKENFVFFQLFWIIKENYGQLFSDSEKSTLPTVP